MMNLILRFAGATLKLIGYIYLAVFLLIGSVIVFANLLLAGIG